MTRCDSASRCPTRRNFLRQAAGTLAALPVLGFDARSGEPAPLPELRGGALAGRRPRVIVSTDIGGSDPDDFQSMIHLLLYADVLDLEGLVSSPPGRGRARDILETLDAYAADHPRLARHGNYPEPTALRRLVRQGETEPAPAAGHRRATDGSRLILERARAEDRRPLWIIVWGSLTDVAQAVHDDPRIKARLRVHSIGSWNTRNDQAARDYLFRRHRDLWWIENDTTFRGMYIGGRQDGDLGNRTFPARHVRGHGALGDLFMRKKPDIKMGDSPSLLFLLRGDPDDPTRPSWGGSYRRTDHGPNHWTDDPHPALREGDRPGARTVNRWREAYLRDWQNRLDRVLSP